MPCPTRTWRLYHRRSWILLSDHSPTKIGIWLMIRFSKSPSAQGPIKGTIRLKIKDRLRLRWMTMLASLWSCERTVFSTIGTNSARRITSWWSRFITRLSRKCSKRLVVSQTFASRICPATEHRRAQSWRGYRVKKRCRWCQSYPSICRMSRPEKTSIRPRCQPLSWMPRSSVEYTSSSIRRSMAFAMRITRRSTSSSWFRKASR